MKRKKLWAWLIAVAIAIVLIWVFLLRKEEQHIAFETTLPAQKDISEKVTATGTIQIVDTVAVGTQVSGIIKAIYVDYNSKVKKGQLLAEIDPTLLQAQADQIKGNLAAAQSSVTYQKATFDRQKQLYETGAISRSDYDNAANSYNTALANKSSIEAQLRSANQNLLYTRIYAPLDGIVLSRNVSVGQTVAASFSTPTLFVLAKDIHKMVVYASVDEADISQVSVGEHATFTVDAYLDNTFNGVVTEMRLQPVTSANVVTYSTLINVDNAEEKLKPGMTATVTIYTQEARNAWTIPVKATRYSPAPELAKEYRLVHLNDKTADEPGTAYVWVKNNLFLTQKKIRTGLNDNTHIAVLSGLQPNDTVIIANPAISETAAAAGGSPFMPKFPSRKKKQS